MSIFQRNLVWLSATRPRTLPVAVAPVLCGSALAWHSGLFRIIPFGLCLSFALLAQIAANFANDYFDFIKGADNANRVGPKRSVASGLIRPSAMRNATIGTCIVAFLIGLGLIPYGGWPLVLIGAGSLICAVAYTGGPFPLGYHGLGDIFVFLFFGPVAVISTCYVQTGSFEFATLPVSISIGLLSANVLVVNNVRDEATDREAGKLTLVVRFGKRYACWQFGVSHFLAISAPLFLFCEGYPVRPLVLPVFAILSIWAIKQYRKLSYARSPSILIPLLGDCGRYVLAYSLALSLALA